MMKKFLLFLLLFFPVSFVSFSQVPQAFNYQAIARDAGGTVLANQSLSVRLSILSGSPTGIVEYAETHGVSTNQFGLFSLPVGTGTVQNGSFVAISWGASDKYLKVELDPAGGSSYVTMGTTQLLSVPYALYADSSRNPGPAGPQGPAGPLVSGTSGQTLRHDGNTWIANSNLYNNGTNLGIGTAAPVSKLEVAGTVRMTGFQLANAPAVGYLLTSDAAGNGTWQPAPAGGGTLDDAYDFGGSGAGRIITADAGAVEINSNTASGTALDVNPTGNNSIGIRVDQTSTGVAIRAENTNTSNTFSTIQAETRANSTAAAALNGTTYSAAYGIAGQAMATSTAQQAIYGSNLRTTGGHGVRGIGFNGTVGETNYSQGYGIYGENFDQITPLGNGVGVAGRGFWGVLGEDRYLGSVSGAYGVYSNGLLAGTSKSFLIDHPDDPEGKFLRHFSVESNQVLNLYRGTVQLDGNGEAVVTLPDYFEGLNRDFSYHLTPVGGFAQLYIKQKITGNTFSIAGSNPGMEVSWMVMAERNDPFFQQNPHQRATEPVKNERQRGKYLMPYLYDQPAEKGMFYRPAGERAEQPVIK